MKWLTGRVFEPRTPELVINKWHKIADCHVDHREVLVFMAQVLAWAEKAVLLM